MFVTMILDACIYDWCYLKFVFYIGKLLSEIIIILTHNRGKHFATSSCFVTDLIWFATNKTGKICDGYKMIYTVTHVKISIYVNWKYDQKMIKTQLKTGAS